MLPASLPSMTVFVVVALLILLQLAVATDSYLAVCLIVKDEHEDMAEWVEYHKRMGVTKIYMFDHNSTIPIINYVKEYVASKLVTYEYLDFHDTDERPQIMVYDLCLQKYGKLHNFMAFIDSDEFIVVPDKRPIPTVLQAYEKYGGVVLNWMGFGSSGHISKPGGGVIANYYKCHQMDTIKSIVNTKHCLRSVGRHPHSFVYSNGTTAVNTAFKPVPDYRNKITNETYQVMYINHYHTRSMVEFAAKLARGRAAMKNPHLLSMESFHQYDNQSTTECPVLTMPPPLV